MFSQNPPIRELAEKKLYMFDMDGTLYLSDQVFDFAVRFILHLRAHGKKVLFLTNNASFSTSFYMEKLTRLGFEPSPEEIMSSADTTIACLHEEYPDALVYLVGTEQVQALFRENGIRLATGEEDRVDVVVSGFDTELTYAKLENACRLIDRGAVYLCTHPDLRCPTATGFMPDAGALAASIIAATGVTPRYLGKPYHDVINLVQKRTGMRLDEMCVFGDRLYTDVALGTKNGACSVLVLTGEAQLSDVPKAPADEQPTYVFPSLAEADEALFGTPDAE